jgi:transposase
MKKTDFRTLPDSTRGEFQKVAVRQHKAGHSARYIATTLGVHYNTARNWIKRYKEGGLKAIKPKKRGVTSEQKRLLTPAQERAIRRKITDRMPDQLKLPYALWTRKSVKELIKREFGIDVAIRTMGDYLNRWGFTPQKPAKRAYEQNPAKVQEWLDVTYPQVKAKAKAEDAEIHWGDETGVKNDCQHGRSYAPRGKTPIRRSQAKHLSINMISSVTNQGKVRFMTYSGSMNAARLIDFLRRLVKGADRKVLLILDNLKVHHSKPVKNWLAQNEGVIEVFHLPSYSPELNPDEYLNCDLKQGVSAKQAPRSQSQMEKNVRSHMKLLQRNPIRVKKYFKNKNINYAA